MINTIKEVMKELAGYHKAVLSALIGISGLFLVLAFGFKVGLFLFPQVVVFILAIGYFTAIRESLDKGQRVIAVRFMEWNFLLSCNTIIFSSLISIGRVFSIIGVIVCFVFTIWFFVNKKSDSYKEIQDTLLGNDKDNDGYVFITEKKKTGDVILGRDTTIDKPIVLPIGDRFLHMLILGPTGCGKTSMIIKPLIYQDLQNPEVGVIVLEPKGDLADDVFGIAKQLGREDIIYFNPELDNCPYFNPLMGDETDVVENLVTTFKMLDNGSSTFFQDNNENLLRRAVKVLKRLSEVSGVDPTLIELDILINNTKGEGINMINEFSRLQAPNDRIRQDNKSIAYWFNSDYFTGTTGDRGATKTFENTSGVRNQLAKLISNPYLNKVLNPKSKADLERNGYLDFDSILENGGVCCISSCQGKLRDLSRFLGFFLILQMQSAVFRRPGTPDTRRGCMFFCDEFQQFSNPGFSDILTMGRSYRIASHLATQNRALIGMNSGNKAKSFTDLVSTNARNKVIFPGGNGEDASYYSKEFGDELRVIEERKISRPVAGLHNMFEIRRENESIGYEETYEKRFRESEIIYKKFGEAVYSVIQNNTLQKPGVMEIEWIPNDIQKAATAFVEEYVNDHRFVIDKVEEVQSTPAPHVEEFDSFEIEDEGVMDAWED